MGITNIVLTSGTLTLATVAETLFYLKHRSIAGSPVQPMKIAAIAIALNMILWVFYLAVVYPRYISGLRHLPTAKRRYPLIGYGPAQFANGRGELFLHMSKTVPNDGLIRFHGFLEAEYLLLTSPQAIQDVLMKNSYDYVKPTGAKTIFKRFLGSEVLFVSEGSKHKNSKRHMQAPFNLNKVKTLYSMFWDKAIQLTDDINDSIASDEKEMSIVNIDTPASNATLDAIVRTTFGEKFENSPQKIELLNLKDTVGSGAWDVRMYFTMSALLPIWTLKLIPGGISKRVDDSSYKVRQSVRTFIKERKSEYGSATSDDIAMQLAATEYYDDDELVSNLLSMIIAGMEPTAAGFAWIVSYLAKYPEWQTKLRDELKANIPHQCFVEDPKSFDAAGVLDHLPILNAVCNEGLRLNPPAPTTNRIAKVDTVILGHPVKAGTKIFISSFVSDRTEEFWGPTASIYDPSRWLNNRDGEKKEAYNNREGAATSTHPSFLPFLHGPRKCIGSMYAQAIIRAFVASLVGRFEFELADKGEEIIGVGVISSKPLNGLKLRLRKIV